MLKFGKIGNDYFKTVFGGFMKTKKNMVFIWFLYGFFIITSPILFGVYSEINNIRDVLQYKKVALNDEFLWKKNIDFLEFKDNFLEKTNGVIGSIDIANEKNCPVYFKGFKNPKSNCFFGDVSSRGCVLVKINTIDFENLHLDDEIFFSCLGERKKFVVKEIKDIYNFNEDVYFDENSKNFNILVCMPYVMNGRKVLIKTRDVETLKETELDFLDLILSSKYLNICFYMFLVYFIAFLIFIIKKIWCFLRKRKNDARVKYVKNLDIFKRDVD